MGITFFSQRLTQICVNLWLKSLIYRQHALDGTGGAANESPVKSGMDRKSAVIRHGRASSNNRLMSNALTECVNLPMEM